MAIKFHTDEYVRSHGRKPSATTFGLWFFRVHSFLAGGGESHDEVQISGTLRVAKMGVRELLAKNGVRNADVVVCP